MQSINGQNINGEVPLCLTFSDLDAYIIEEHENKYLVFTLTENNKEVLKLYKKLWSKIRRQIKTKNSVESIKYKNDFMKIKVDLNDDLPLNKILYIPVLDIAESVFQIRNEYYPQICIDECEYKRE